MGIRIERFKYKLSDMALNARIGISDAIFRLKQSPIMGRNVNKSVKSELEQQKASLEEARQNLIAHKVMTPEIENNIRMKETKIQYEIDKINMNLAKSAIVAVQAEKKQEEQHTKAQPATVTKQKPTPGKAVTRTVTASDMQKVKESLAQLAKDNGCSPEVIDYIMELDNNILLQMYRDNPNIFDTQFEETSPINAYYDETADNPDDDFDYFFNQYLKHGGKPYSKSRVKFLE